MILDHHVSARRPKALLTLGLVWLVLIGLWLLLDAAWWVLAPFALFSVPAGVEALRGTTAQLWLDRTSLGWDSPRQSHEVSVAGIDRVRFDTRLDLAINARVHLTDGTMLRIPVECVPPYGLFCAALDAAGIRHERHHFGVF